MNQQQIVVIGVVEDSKDRITFKSLKEILIMGNYKIYYENKNESMAVLIKENINLTIIDINPKIINSIEAIGIDFNILVHTFLNQKDYKNKKLKKIFKNSKHIIANCDEDNWTSLLDNNIESIVITYGFNNKATINPSSYNIHDLIETNICLQREINTINGDVVEPFELPIKIDSREILHIYSVLAIISCSLLLGIDMVAINPLMFFSKK